MPDNDSPAVWDYAHHPIGSPDLVKCARDPNWEAIGGYAIGLRDALGQPEVAYMMVLRRWVGPGPHPFAARPALDLGLLTGGAS